MEPATSSRPARKPWPPWLQALLLFAVTLVSSLPGLGRLEFVGTEDYRARIAQEMLDSREWLQPTLYGLPILTKPPLHYWALAAAIGVSGERSPGSTRWIGLLAVAVTVASIGYAAARAGGARAGWIAGLGYLVGAYTVRNGVTAEIDPVFTMFTVLAVLAWYACLHAPGRGAAAWALGAGLAAGLAALTKGGAVLPFVFGAALAAWVLGPRPRWNVTAAAAAAFLPLAVAWPLQLRYGEFAEAGGAIQESVGVIWYWDASRLRRTILYPLALVFAAAPFTLPAFVRLRSAGRATLDRYLIVVVAGAFCILMLAASKSTRYLMPCFPLLVVAGALRLELLARTHDFVRGCAVLGLLAAAALVPLARDSLDVLGAAVLASLALAGIASWFLAPRLPALALLLLVFPVRALMPAVYAPHLAAGPEATAPAVAGLDALLGGARRVGVAWMHTPRLLDPLERDIVFFSQPPELFAALAADAPLDALVINWLPVLAEPEGFALTGEVEWRDKTFRVYHREGAAQDR